MRKRILILNTYNRNRMTGINRLLIFKTGILLLLFTYVSLTHAQLTTIRSLDGKYEAKLVGKFPDLHFQVMEIKTDSVLFTTHAKYPTKNNVKTGKFSPDSKKFAAAYHYSGPYTWVGVWEIETKEFYSEEKPEFLYDISWIFKMSPSNISPDGKYKATKIKIASWYHYRVIEIKTNRVILTTFGPGPEVINDAKAMKFSPDSKDFAAVYHKADKGRKSWIGIWSTESGKRRDRWVIENGFVTTISDTIFNR